MYLTNHPTIYELTLYHMDLPELVEGGRVALRRRGVRQAHPAELGGVGAVALQLRIHVCSRGRDSSFSNGTKFLNKELFKSKILF